jgi:RNA polymerase sigma-70 factor (ECF subfamily)
MDIKNNYNSPATFSHFTHLLYGAMKINLIGHQLLRYRKNCVVRTQSELIQQMHQGDRQAFAELYEHHKTAIYRYCLRMLTDSDAAKDATQETFIKMFSNIGFLKKPDSFLPWLFSIARNEVMMHMRRNRRNGVQSDDDIWDRETPYDLMVTAETTEIVQRLLQNLKSEYREVILLREYEQLSYAQIAEVTADTESSVKSRLFKARKALTKKLKEYYI